MKRFPYWLRQSVRGSEDFTRTKELISGLQLNTVCQSGRCPNIHDCFSSRRCTFLILGRACTRSCRFCAVRKKKFELNAPDKAELLRIKEAAEVLGLKHVIVTSVTRDDLIDGGAGHFAECINILRRIGSGLKIEVLVPDFLGDKESIQKVVSARPDILSHNLETAPRLYSKVRPEADYSRSLEVLRYAKEFGLTPVAEQIVARGKATRKDEDDPGNPFANQGRTS